MSAIPKGFGEPFEISVSHEGETSTLAFAGEFDLAQLDLARARLDEVERNGTGHIVIDLRELTFIDSTGIAFLLGAIKRDERGRLSFIPSQTAAVRRVLGITGVDGIFGGDNASAGATAGS